MSKDRGQDVDDDRSWWTRSDCLNNEDVLGIMSFFKSKCSLQDRGRKRVGPKTTSINSPTWRKYTIEFHCAKGIQVDFACSLNPEDYVFCVFPRHFFRGSCCYFTGGEPVNIQGTHQFLSRGTTCLEITILSVSKSMHFLLVGTKFYIFSDHKSWNWPGFSASPPLSLQTYQTALLLMPSEQDSHLMPSDHWKKPWLLRDAYKVYKGFYYVAFLYRWLVTILNQDVLFQLV